MFIPPSTSSPARPAPEFVKDKVVLDPSFRSNVYVPEAILCIVVSLALICSKLEAESSARSPEPPEDIVRAPLAARLVVVPKLKVPPPAWMVRLPLAVDQVAAAAEVRVKPPEEVVKLEAPLADNETVPVDCEMLPVKTLPPLAICSCEAPPSRVTTVPE
jgi:hypothetical protein